jgi:hypothetical protein
MRSIHCRGFDASKLFGARRNTYTATKKCLSVVQGYYVAISSVGKMKLPTC